MLKLLKQTKEYKNFTNLIDDSGGAVRNVDKENKNIATTASELYELDEDQWAPSDAYDLANEFRAKHGNELTPNLIKNLLGDLNKIWREREKKQI